MVAQPKQTPKEIAERRPRPFVGREDLISLFSQAITRDKKADPRNVLVFYSVARVASPNLFGDDLIKT